MRALHLILIALAAIVAVQDQPAKSQERIPVVPSKQTPPVTASLAANLPSPPLADTSIERTSQVDEGEPTPPDNLLKELAWMVGDWVADDENPGFESSVKWSKNGAFLIHSFRVSNAKAEPRSGMQIIAWDPAEKRIRSWTFDSRGGFGDEFWSRSGDQWSIRKRFTLPDGGRASAVQVMTRVSDDAFRWKSVNRVIDGSLQPDVDEVTIVRKSAEITTTQDPNTPEGEKQP